MSIVRAGMLVAVLSAACAAVDPMRLAPPSAAGVWDGGVTVSAGPADAGPAPSSPSERVELGVPEAGRTYDLVALVDLAQKSNPETRIAWESARAAAAALGEAASSATPSGDVDAYLALSRRLIAATAHLEDVLRDYTGLLVTSPGGTQLRKVQSS